MFWPITTSYTPSMGVPVTLVNRVAGYSPLSFCSIAVAPGSGGPACATLAAIASATAASALVLVFIASDPLQPPLAGGSVGHWVRCGADVQPSVDHRALRQYD